MQLNQVLGALELEQPHPEVTAFHRELAGKINATLEHHPEAAQICLERLRYLVLSDRVGFYFDVSADWEDGRIVLRGLTERREFKDITREVFRHLGFASVEDRIEIVPDARVNPDPFGVTVAVQVLTWSEPDFQGVPMDEALYGEPVYLLKELPEAWLIKTLTGYWGYARKDGLRRLDKNGFVRWLNEPKATLLEDYRTGGYFLPSGCRLSIEDWGEGATCRLALPDGGSVQVPKSVCQRSERDRAIERLIAYARTFERSPYHLGGKNRTTGIDCSGLVQLSYRTVGLNLPRDAKQQYLGGQLILPCVTEALLPGDALFFMNEAGLVDHVALYLGAGEILHASEDRVKLESLNPAAPDYLERLRHDFIGAKRFWW